jgi:hypothetical protein
MQHFRIIWYPVWQQIAIKTRSAEANFIWPLSFLWYKTVVGYVTASLSIGSENEICVIK